LTRILRAWFAPEFVMPDGLLSPVLRIPQIFFGLSQTAGLVKTLNHLITQIGDVADPRSQWFMADTNPPLK
jgi:hypothetical protein